MKLEYLITLLLLFCIVGYKYYLFTVLHEYEVVSTVACDPAFESCFVEVCDFSNECDMTPYKYIHKNANSFHTCEVFLNEVICPEQTCSPNESDCEIVFCNEEVRESWEKCENHSNFVL